MQAQWYFDFVSPFSYLQWPKVQSWRKRLDITPVPIVFGAVLKQLGNLGPAEIPGKREFAYRNVLWQAQRDGVALRFPPTHPFNPMLALRLCIALGTSWEAIDAIFTHIWRDGKAATSATDLADIGHRFGIENVENVANAENVKLQLRANTEAAISAHVFGVPMLCAGELMFWGNESSPMIDAWLADPAHFDSPEYRRVAKLPIGIERRR